MFIHTSRKLGGTGFIGRLFLAKLMRIGNVKEILLLSRPKKGKSNDERLVNILSGFLFEEVDKFDVNFKSKLRIINGDMELDGLGISHHDREYIKNHAEVIIHAAATVRFDEQLRKAIAINVCGTKAMLDIALEVKNLHSFVHISTAYSNCPRSDIQEVFYEPPVDYRLALEFLKRFDDDAINALTAKLITPWPNTYTFTKAISEDMIRQHQDLLPISIVRPSIVQGTHKDPVAGFADSIMGFVGIGAGYMVGLLRVSRFNPASCVDVIPADFVVNSILAVSKHSTEMKLEAEKPKIFNCIISNVQKIPMNWIIETASDTVKKYPIRKMIWVPGLTFTKTNFTFKLLYFLYHYVPAFFIDIGLRLSGSNLRLSKIYSKIYYYIQLYSFFVNNTWTFHNDNMKKIHSILSVEDHEEFPCTAAGEEFEPYLINEMRGVRKYFFKESDEDLVYARRKYKILKMISYTFFVIFYSSIAYYLILYINKSLIVHL